MTQVVKDLVTWLQQWFYTESEVNTLLDGKQATLVSGTNIKTVNNNSLLGSGNISISGSGGVTFDDVYPIGSIYMSVNSTSPSTLFGGTWVQLKDTFLLACGDTYSNGATGGSADAVVVEHTHEQNPHSHSISAIHPLNNSATASSSAHTTNWSNHYSTVSGTDDATATNKNTGESGTGKNMPPYVAVYVWKRIADVDNIILSINNTILSAYHSNTATIQATCRDASNNLLNGVTVEFFKGSTSLGTATTNSSGIATKTYTADGSGDITITASAGGVTSGALSIEDCNYYNTNEVSRTTTQGSTIYDNNLSQSLPTNCEISFDIYSNNSSTSEHRFFLLPKSQYSSGTTQPSYAIYTDLTSSNKQSIGKRQNNSSSNLISAFTTTLSEYHRFKLVKTGTSFEAYVDNVSKGTFSLSWIGNYTDYTISMMRWSATGTSKIKNVKFKAL